MFKKGELHGAVISRLNSLIVAATLLGAGNLATHAAEINGKLIHAVALVESGNNPRAVGDQGRANGAFQMWKPAWADCSRWLERNGFKSTPYEKGVNDPNVSHQYCKIYLSILHRQLARALDRDVTAADLYCAYNLGFAGYRKRGFDLARCPGITQRAVAKLYNHLED